MNENWYVLLIAILKNTTVEQSFKLYKTGDKIYHLTEEDIRDIIKLKGEMSQRELAVVYNVSQSTIAHRIIKFRKKVAKC